MPIIEVHILLPLTVPVPCTCAHELMFPLEFYKQVLVSVYDIILHIYRVVTKQNKQKLSEKVKNVNPLRYKISSQIFQKDFRKKKTKHYLTKQLLNNVYK